MHRPDPWKAIALTERPDTVIRRVLDERQAVCVIRETFHTNRKDRRPYSCWATVNESQVHPVRTGIAGEIGVRPIPQTRKPPALQLDERSGTARAVTKGRL